MIAMCDQCGHLLYLEYIRIENGIHPVYYDGDNSRETCIVVSCRDCGNWLDGQIQQERRSINDH